MTFSKKAILLSGILLCISVQLGAQVRQTREEYISRYMPIAIAHMERYGIPAVSYTHLTLPTKLEV